MKKKLLIAMVLCLLLASFMISCSKKNIFISELPNQETNKTFLRDVSEHYSFEIVSEHDIDDSNFTQFIKITDTDNNIKDDLKIEKKDNYFIISPKEKYVPEKTYFITLTNAKFRDQRYSNELAISIKKPEIEQVVYVESINIRLFDDSNEIGLTESKLIKAEILPYNATYQNYQYSIEKIEKQDGTLYSGDLTQYAVIENNILTATDKIAIGAKIYISATTVNDQIKSNVLVIEVKRIGIEKIDFYALGQRNDINLGEELSLTMTIFPSNATINILNDSPINVTLNDSTLAVLTKIDDIHYKLTALDNLANVNKEITLTVTAEDYSKNYFHQICTIPIESIVIYNSDTNIPLERDIALFRNNTLNLSAVITPVNATVNQARFNLSSDIQNFGRFASIDANGKLIISEDAPFGMILYLSATALRKSSGPYTITINQIPVKSVLLSSEKNYIIKNSFITLKAYIYPENADTSITQFKIINEVQDVYISGNMLFASENVVVDTEIKVKAIVDGVESNILSIRIINNPDVLLYNLIKRK